jgi:hypothetical protein
VLTRERTLVSAGIVRSRLTSLHVASGSSNTATKRTRGRKVIMIDTLCILLFILWYFYGDD